MHNEKIKTYVSCRIDAKLFTQGRNALWEHITTIKYELLEQLTKINTFRLIRIYIVVNMFGRGL